MLRVVGGFSFWLAIYLSIFPPFISIILVNYNNNSIAMYSLS